MAGQVAVTLVQNDRLILGTTLYTSGNSRGPAVRCMKIIGQRIKHAIGAAAHRIDNDGVFDQPKFLQRVIIRRCAIPCPQPGQKLLPFSVKYLLLSYTICSIDTSLTSSCP